MQEKVFLSRISMSAKQEKGRIEHHIIDIKKIFLMHPGGMGTGTLVHSLGSMNLSPMIQRH